jgi:di/tricarboxylate transporter
MADIVLVFSILIASVILLVSEWLPMEVVALLAMSIVALTGLVSPQEALSGFSSPAVVTVWAVFILSGGLTRTGVANIIGRQVLRLAGSGETLIVVVIMLTSGIMSAIMNNVAVAALMLPVVMDIARHTNRPPSRLLMPLAYGSLLGGLTTLIGTPPNILVSDALRDNGLKPFTVFDFTPVGGVVMVAGILFVALIGRRLLPVRDVATASSTPGHLDLREQYDLRERLFMLRVPVGSVLVGATLVESRLGSLLGLHVLGMIRNGHTRLSPDPTEVLHAGDGLLVEGRIERLKELGNWRRLSVYETGRGRSTLEELFAEGNKVAEAVVAPNSPMVGKSLAELGFRTRFGVNVLAILQEGRLKRTDLRDERLKGGDALLLHGPSERLEQVREDPALEGFRFPEERELSEIYRLDEAIFYMQIPEQSALIGKTLEESHLGDALGLRVLSIRRADGTHVTPGPDERFSSGDCLTVEGKPEVLSIVQGLEDLEVERESLPDQASLESARVGLVEAVLAPRTTLAGKTLRDLHFREKYGLSVLAVWREGKARRTDLRDVALRFGDALLLYGPREKLRRLGREPDFLVLTQDAQEPPLIGKAKVSVLIMAAVIVPVILGLVPISIAAVTGAALMVLTRCLTMEEAYRNIEWRAVFLIAGMLPLGIALHRTGAAKLLAEGVVAMAGPFGPLAVVAGLMCLTFVATCFIPTAALVVLMTPIVLSTAADMSLSPHALMMAVAMAASASFMTPISHPANVLVMGPGGYRFIDYFKLGLPLSLIVLVVVLLVLPYFWPLTP